MKLPKRENGGMGMAFLDVISCGFGAMVLLVLISRPGLSTSENLQDVGSLLARTFQMEKELKQLDDLLDGLKLKLADNLGSNEEARLAEQRITTELTQKLAKLEQLSADISTLEYQGNQMRKIQLSNPDEPANPDEVGGIPVDRDYVVFVIDRSGSMNTVESRVQYEFQKVLNSHPQVKGFQVMNDNGNYLFRSSSMLQDTPANRSRTLNAFARFRGNSDSDPVDGIEKALHVYQDKAGELALYVFGDDYSNNTFDGALASINRANRKGGKRIARIHAIGFVSRGGGGIDKFSTLMREVAHQNDGAFIGLPR